MAAIVASLQSQGIRAFNIGDEEYERSVATANLLFRYTRPDCVVQPQSASDVQATIAEAKRANLSITIKNGGHSYAGFSSADKGISLDLSKMQGADLDMDKGIITLQGGALWGHAYKKLVNGRHDGYIINGGRCPTVGVSGFTLGGGLGPFTRSFGMGCDTLKEATIVTADQQIVTVRDTDDPKTDKGKLFWALCGAGGGNFGVLVEMKLAVQKLSNPEGNVVAGKFVWSPQLDAVVSDSKKLASTKQESMDKFKKTMNNFYTADWPQQATIDSTWLCDLKDKEDIKVRFLVYYDGNQKDFDKLIDKKIDDKDLAKNFKRRAMQEKSTRFLHETLVSQWSEETIKSFPSERSFSIYTSFVFKNNKDRIQGITSVIADEMLAFRRLFNGEKATLSVTWIHTGGKASEKQRSATAFRWRDCQYHAYIMITWEDKFLERDMRGFLQQFKQQLKPFSMMRRAAFINFADATLTQETAEKAYYGNNQRQLQKVKRIWDKGDFWNWEQGVRLPGARPSNKFGDSQEPPLFATFSALSATGPEGGEGSFGTHNDDESGDEGPVVDEQALTDQVAGQQWENFTVPKTTSQYSGGGVFALDDLGF